MYIKLYPDYKIFNKKECGFNLGILISLPVLPYLTADFHRSHLLIFNLVDCISLNYQISFTCDTFIMSKSFYMLIYQR